MEIDGEENETLDRAMEYARAIGIEVANMLASVHQRVKALEPRVPAQHTFGRDGLWDFICNHQDRLEHLEGQVQDLTTMMEHTVGRLSVANKVQRQLINKLLMQVMVLEGTREDLILIPDSLAPILVPPPGLGPGSVLVEIKDRTDDAAAQAIMEDQAEGVGRRWVTIEEGGVFGVTGELYKEGEDIMDVLRWVEVRGREIPRYRPPPSYDDEYVPNHQA